MCKKSGINLIITIAMVTKMATKNPENMKVTILEHIWERKWNIGKGWENYQDTQHINRI